MSRLPNFFIVGAPKAATTSLYHYLDQHPQVYMSVINEPHFFATEIREENCDSYVRREMARDIRGLHEFLSGPMREKHFGGITREWQDYLSLFAGATDEAGLGEASPCYLWSPTAPEGIASRLQGARILVMLREPVDRAFAHIFSLGNGAIRCDFRQHIRRNQSHGSGQLAVHYPFLGSERTRNSYVYARDFVMKSCGTCKAVALEAWK
jgi:Sulfotransferase family